MKRLGRPLSCLASAYPLIVEFLIWMFVAVVPIFDPPVLMIRLGAWLIRRRNRVGARGPDG